MTTYSQYDILTSRGEKELIAKVNEAIKQGWQPLGGIGLALWGFFQAMVK